MNSDTHTYTTPPVPYYCATTACNRSRSLTAVTTCNISTSASRCPRSQSRTQAHRCGSSAPHFTHSRSPAAQMAFCLELPHAGLPATSTWRAVQHPHDVQYNRHNVLACTGIWLRGQNHTFIMQVQQAGWGWRWATRRSVGACWYGFGCSMQAKHSGAHLLLLCSNITPELGWGLRYTAVVALSCCICHGYMAHQCH
jgi:hypothetical protein